MEISEVRVKLVNRPQERLRAFCSITLDNDFVIRDLKIIDGANGTFVAMPSRKLADRCPHCGHKNHLRARFCNDCGQKLSENRDKRTARRSKLHADIAHPINAACRERIQNTVIEAFEEELEKSKQPGYKPIDLDEDFDGFDDEVLVEVEPADSPQPAARPQPAVAKAQPVAGQAQPGAGTRDYDNGGGYDELIADLKRDAAHRRTVRGSGPVTSSSVSDDDDDARSSQVAVDASATQDDNDDAFGAGLL